MNTPNVAPLRSVLRHEGIAGPVPFFELGTDLEIMQAVLGHAIPADDVTDRRSQLLELLGNSGSWCLGTGNTAANYIPLANYLAMLDEGNRWNVQWR